MKIPFGKYKDWPISDTPQDYLVWILRNINNRPELTDAIRIHLGLVDWEKIELQETCNMLRSQIARMRNVEDTGEKYKSRIRIVQNKMTLKYHPDRGGDHKIMCVVNEIFDELNKPILS